MAEIDTSPEHERSPQAADLRKREQEYRKILEKELRNTQAWFSLGCLCAEQRRFAEAVANFRQTLQFEPSHAAAHLLLGNALLQLGHYADAEDAYLHCLKLQPQRVEAMVNLGYALGEQEKFDEAIDCYERARALAPTIPEIHHNLGNMLREKNRLDEALASYDQALKLRPDYTKAHINKGIALARCCQVNEAVESLRRGVALQPDFAEAHNSLGTALFAQGRLNEAEAAYARALELNPDYPDTYWNQSLVRLLRGDYERGWQEYEWRWRCKKRVPLPAFSEPRWDGSSLAGQTILLYAEQGLGDTLHFVRYAVQVKERGGRVILQCQGSIIPLLTRTPGIDGLVAWGAIPPRFDVWLPLMSLPAVFRSTLATIPASIPYVFTDPSRSEQWRLRLAPVSGFTIGIAWQGSTQHAWDRHRSTSLAQFAPLAQIPGVQLISLQKNTGGAEANQDECPFPLISFGDWLDRDGAFTDTAAIIQNLDLVITVDTAVAHLAGALGRPTWIALHRTPDWRWLLDRTDTPWYPTVRLFRQRTAGEWSPVFQEIAAQLSDLVARKKATRPLMVEVSCGELLDKLAILQIKSERIANPQKQRNIQLEREALLRVRATLESSPRLEELECKLKQVNEQLWEIEDEIRLLEHRQDFGPRFVELARAVYLTNDRRAALKREVNALLQSRLVEEKSYSHGAFANHAPSAPSPP